MTDVRHYHTPDGGEIDVVNGQWLTDSGLESAVYYSLFGGNERDSGAEADDRLQWWGNLSERDPARRYRSETQYLLRALPAVPANLRRFEDAANRDLEWLKALASSLAVRALLPALNTVVLRIVGEVRGEKLALEFRNPSTRG